MSSSITDTIILGIDPGTRIFGYGAIQIVGKEIKMLSMGSVHLTDLPNYQLKLKRIFERVTWLIDTFHPDMCSLEAPFYGKNAQSMLKLGRAQGVSMAAALARDVPVVEYSPKRIKQAITGNGNASKEQVAALLQSICKFTKQPKYLDATDGLAAAVCHYYTTQSPMGKATGSKASSWKQFIKDNPNRIRK